MVGYVVGIGIGGLFIGPWGVVPQLIILGMIGLFVWIYRKQSKGRPATMETIGEPSSREAHPGNAGPTNAGDGVRSDAVTADHGTRRDDRGRGTRRPDRPEIVGGIDVSGTEFTVRGGRKWDDAGLRPDRGRYIYGDDDEIRGRILHKKPTRGTYLIQDPDNQTVCKLQRVEGGSVYQSVVRGKARRYDLLEVETERTLGIFEQHEPGSPHWSYRIPDLDVYAVVSNTVLPWGGSTTIDRANGPSICHVDTSLFGVTTTLAMERLHPRLKLLILSTGHKVG